jgi:hypothetical protein
VSRSIRGRNRAAGRLHGSCGWLHIGGRCCPSAGRRSRHRRSPRPPVGRGYRVSFPAGFLHPEARKIQIVLPMHLPGCRGPEQIDHPDFRVPAEHLFQVFEIRDSYSGNITGLGWRSQRGGLGRADVKASIYSDALEQQI